MEKSYDLDLGASPEQHFSDMVENQLKYMNLNYVDNSETSSQTKADEASTGSEPQLELPITESAAAFGKPQGIKPLQKSLSSLVPKYARYTAHVDEAKPKKEAKVKSLLEMGFSISDIEGWDDIKLPFKEDLCTALRRMIENQINPDVKIRIGSVVFDCHMVVLQCYSEFFLECNNELLIQLPEEKISPEAFSMVYSWMVTDSPNVQRKGLISLLSAAVFLRIQRLIDQCWHCLDDDLRFREDAALLAYLEARDYQLKSVEELMVPRLFKIFLTFVASKNFLGVTTAELCTLLGLNTIGVNSEVEVFMSAVRWISWNWEDREKEIVPIMKCIRFGLMPPWYLVMLHKGTECELVNRIVAHPEIKKMISDGISYTTTKMFYDKEFGGYVEFLERYQLVVPQQRQWVFDKDCPYHHNLACPGMEYISYKSFLKYLSTIKKGGKDYWKKLEKVPPYEKSPLCCEQLAAIGGTNNGRGLACHKMRNPSHGQSVQETITSVPQGQQAQTADTLRLRVQTKLCSSRPIEARGSIFDTLTLAQYRRIQESATKSTEQLAVRLYRSFQDKQQSPKEPLQQVASKEPKQSEMDALQKDMCKQSISLECRSHPNDKMNHEEVPAKAPETRERLDGGGDIPEVGAVPDQVQLPICSAQELCSMKGPKILVFGGVDPYCQHCKEVEAQQQGMLNSSGSNCSDDYLLATVMQPSSAPLSNNYGDKVLLFDEPAACWKQVATIPFGSRHHHVAVRCNGLIYIVGGTRTALGCSKNSLFQRSIWSFNPSTLEWTIECRLPEGRRDFGVIAIDGETERCPATPKSSARKRASLGTGFFIIGGEGVNGAALDTVWFYDVLRKQWTQKASLNVGRYGFAATLVNNEIWIAGGIINDGTAKPTMLQSEDHCDEASPTLNSSNKILNMILEGGRATEIITNTIEYYSLNCMSADGSRGRPCGFCDTAAEGGGQWITSKLYLRVPRVFPRLCKLSSTELYLVGGIGFVGGTGVLTSLDEVDYFDFLSARWQHCGNINWARHGHDVAALNERLVVIGGVSTIEKRTLTSVEQFCTQLRECLEQLPELPWPLSGCSVVLLD